MQNISRAAHASTANLWSTKMTGLRLVVDSTDGKMSYSSLLNNNKMSTVTCCQNIHIRRCVNQELIDTTSKESLRLAIRAQF